MGNLSSPDTSYEVAEQIISGELMALSGTFIEESEGYQRDWIDEEVDIHRALEFCAKAGDAEAAVIMAAALRGKTLAINCLLGLMPKNEEAYRGAVMIASQEHKPDERLSLSALVEAHRRYSLRDSTKLRFLHFLGF